MSREYKSYKERKELKGKGKTFRGKDKRSGKDKCNSENPEFTTTPSCVVNGSKDNDVSWYSQNPTQLAITANFPFGNPLGNILPAQTKDNCGFTTDGQDGMRTNIHLPNPSRKSVPGICVLQYTPTPGISKGSDSVLNIAARKIYAYVRHMQSGSKNYDPSDLMIYLLAMDQAYAFHAWMTRVYGTLNIYNTFNKFYPVELVRAQGANFDDLILNMPNFLSYINTFGEKISGLCVPARMPFMLRHSWMNAGVYKDTTSVKGQTYLFNPSCFYKFGLDEKGAGMLEPKYFTGPKEMTDIGFATQLTFENIVAYGNELISSIVGNEDFGTISGDIFKAFGTDVIKIETIPPTYKLAIDTNIEVLVQIQNSVVTGFIDYDSEAARITQNVEVGKGAILCNVLSAIKLPSGYTNSDLTTPKLFTMPVDNPNPGDNMVASRLITRGVKSTDDEGNAIIEFTHGTEIINTMYFVRMEQDNPGGGIIGRSTKPIIRHLMLYGMEGAVTSNQLVSDISAFAFHPEVSVWYESADFDASTKELSYIGTLYDVNNYTLLTYEDLKAMNDIALMSLFSVPSMAKF